MLFAHPVGIESAKQLGMNFAKNTMHFKDIQREEVRLAYSIKTDSDTPCLYVFNLSNRGFVVVSGEDCVKPILGYSDEGAFIATDIADGLDFMMRSYCDEIQYVREHRIEATPDIVNEWERIAAEGRISDRRDGAGVPPLLETTWNQNTYYNDLCPEDADGPNGHVYSGCVAASMAQVMKFWNHPVRGTGSYSYTPSSWGYPSYPEQTANFGETYYNFEKTPRFLDSTSTDEEVFYIAQLQHH